MIEIVKVTPKPWVYKILYFIYTWCGEVESFLAADTNNDIYKSRESKMMQEIVLSFSLIKEGTMGRFD